MYSMRYSENLPQIRRSSVKYTLQHAPIWFLPESLIKLFGHWKSTLKFSHPYVDLVHWYQIGNLSFNGETDALLLNSV